MDFSKSDKFTLNMLAKYFINANNSGRHIYVQWFFYYQLLRNLSKMKAAVFFVFMAVFIEYNVNHNPPPLRYTTL